MGLLFHKRNNKFIQGIYANKDMGGWRDCFIFGGAKII